VSPALVGVNTFAWYFGETMIFDAPSSVQSRHRVREETKGHIQRYRQKHFAEYLNDRMFQA